jgi:hypothetical protein
LAAVLAPSVYALRVACTSQIACTDDTLSILCPDATAARWLERSLGRKAAEIAALFVDEAPQILFVAPE